MLMKLVGQLRFLNEYGELETVKPGYQAEASDRVAVGASGAGMVLIFFLLVHLLHVHWRKWLGVIFLS